MYTLWGGLKWNLKLYDVDESVIFYAYFISSTAGILFIPYREIF